MFTVIGVPKNEEEAQLKRDFKRQADKLQDAQKADDEASASDDGFLIKKSKPTAEEDDDDEEEQSTDLGRKQRVSFEDGE